MSKKDTKVTSNNTHQICESGDKEIVPRVIYDSDYKTLMNMFIELASRVASMEAKFNELNDTNTITNSKCNERYSLLVDASLNVSDKIDLLENEFAKINEVTKIKDNKCECSEQNIKIEAATTKVSENLMILTELNNKIINLEVELTKLKEISISKDKIYQGQINLNTTFTEHIINSEAKLQDFDKIIQGHFKKNLSMNVNDKIIPYYLPKKRENKADKITFKIINYQGEESDLNNIKDLLLSENSWLQNFKFQVNKIYKVQSKNFTYQNIEVGCESDLLLEINKRLFIYIYNSKLKCYENTNLVQCKNCSNFGHTKINCVYNTTCKYCAENHDSNLCTSMRLVCINCIDFNKNTNTNVDYCHAATYEGCAYRQKIISNL